MAKSYKKTYEELQAQLNIDTKKKEHQKHYINIQLSWADIGRFFALVGVLD